MKNLTKMVIAVSVGLLVPLLMAPRNGAGTYTLPAGNPVVSGTTISSTVHNNTMSDIATALTGSLTKDGQTTATANQPMGGFRHTNVGNPTLRSQYGTVDNIQDGDYVVLSSVAGTNTITAALSPTPTAYVAGMQVVLIPANANTGATTLNISSIGALDLQKWSSGAQANIVANDLRAGVPAYLVLDTGGDDWILLNPNSGNIGDVTVGTLTATTVNPTTINATTINSTTSNPTTLNAGTVNATTTATTNLTLNGNTVGGAANPSGTIGLSANNGSANTWMRSDGRPALSQAIAPTWTDIHTFSNVPTSSIDGSMLLSDTNNPILGFSQSGASANNKVWDFVVSGTQFLGRTANDSGAGNVNWLAVSRSGTAVTRVAFPTDSNGTALSVGTTNTGLGGLARMETATASTAALTLSNVTDTAYTLGVWNKATSGDNVLVQFFTEGSSGTLRGSITYNRGGGVMAYNTTSDERLKKNFKPATSAKSVIDCIKVESFDWKETGNHVDHGFVAQHLNKCTPYAVSSSSDPKKIWGVDPSKLVPVMIKYIQEQDARISNLEAELSRLH